MFIISSTPKNYIDLKPNKFNPQTMMQGRGVVVPEGLKKHTLLYTERSGFVLINHNSLQIRHPSKGNVRHEKILNPSADVNSGYLKFP